MIKRSVSVLVIYALEAIAVLFALLLFAGVGLLWRLSQGPMELDFLLADAQAELAEAFGGDLVSLGRLEARFDTESGLLVISAQDLTVAEAGGEVITRAPLLEAGFGLDALLVADLAPSRVAVEGGSVSIVRREDGAVGAGLGTPERVARTARQPGSQRDADAILELLRNPDDNALLGRLTSVSIRSASIRVIDDVNQLEWYVDRANLLLERNEARLEAELSGRFVTTAGYSPVAVRLEAGAALNDFLLEARTDNLSPRALAPRAGPFASLGEIDAPISLELFANASRADGIRGANLNLEVGEGRIGRGETAQSLRQLTARLEYEPLDGAIRIQDARIDSQMLTTAISGRLFNLRGFDDAFPREWDYELQIGAGRLDLGGVFEAPPEWDAIELSGGMNASEIEIGFNRLSAEIGPITAILEGSARLRQVEGGQWLPDVRLTGPVEGDVSPQMVLLFWPVELADGARDWIEGAVISGRLFDAYLDLDLNAEALVAKRLANERMTLTFSFEDAAFRYISTMTPVTGGQGQGTLFGNSFELTMDEGYIGDTPVTDGYVNIPRLNPRGALATFGGSATAQAEAVLSLIDEPPLNLVSDYGLDPASISGQGDITFEIQRPMRTQVAVEDVGFDIRADFSDVTMDTGIQSLMLTEGSVLLTAQPDLLEATGTAQLAGAPTRIRWIERFGLGEGVASTELDLQARLTPTAFDQLGVPIRRFVDGPVDIEVSTLGEAFDFQEVNLTADLEAARVEWPGSAFVKPADEAAVATASLRFEPEGPIHFDAFSLNSRSAAADASAVFARDGRLLSAELSRVFVENYVEAALIAERPSGPDGPLAFAINGAYFNASELLPELTDFSGAGGAPPPLGLTVLFEEVEVAGGRRYSDLALEWISDDAVGEQLTVRLETAEGPFSLDLSALPGERRQIEVVAPDFGELLRVLDLYQNVEGGVLRMSGSTPAAGETGRSDYRLEADDFTLIRMPVLARILAAGSLPGLAALLSEEGGIAFDVLRSDIVVEDGSINISEARATGASLGVTTEGRINMDDRRLALDGVLAPSYGLNSFVGNLPLVGEALVSRPGEGVFGITFSAEGPFSEPTVTANPLSVLAPGVLRRIFEGTAADRERARQDSEHSENAAPSNPDSTDDEDG
ncbi:DUF3971 domain-containing protein [Hyphobacterium sp.]|uniref:YhdP family protein n=1 Tax=Hyphobacterium sp. TaxID=2004662 RepID=UPI003BADA2DD